MTAAAPAPRIVALDAVRGVAVMGILLLNIVDFAMPGYAYVDPNFYGGATGANWWAWAINFVLFDAKMRGLFTILFGASMVLVADEAEARGVSAARVHFARMAVLFGIGMAHAYLIWAGDILVLYAVCGAIAFAAWRWPPRLLIAAACVLLAYKLANGLVAYDHLHALQQAASAPGASEATRQVWDAARTAITQSPADIPADLAAYRGGYTDALAARSLTAAYLQAEAGLDTLPDTVALMLIGMVLYRSGFFTAGWPRRVYRRLAVVPLLVCLPLYLPLVAWIETTHFSPVTLAATDAIHLTLLRPLLSLAYASLVILVIEADVVPRLIERIAAAGRMALSNYLGTSVVCTLIFNGYGLGWYGYLARWQCYGVVLLVWVLMLLWSKPWLERFAYGPAEWLWRSLARGHLQPMRRRS